VAELERHLAGCPACVAYLKTYRKTQELTSEVTRVPMPEEMKARLRRLLLEQLAKGAS
jgi:anti-sigma factor RsiW